PQLANADDRRGHDRVAQHPGGGVARQRHVHLAGQADEVLDDVETARGPRRIHIEARRDEGAELAGVARTGGVRDGPALAVAPGEPAALQGAPHDRPEAMRLAHGKDLALRLAREDGVRRLRRDEALEVAALADPE